jgi:hypothetical protein
MSNYSLAMATSINWCSNKSPPNRQGAPAHSQPTHTSSNCSLLWCWSTLCHLSPQQWPVTSTHNWVIDKLSVGRAGKTICFKSNLTHTSWTTGTCNDGAKTFATCVCSKIVAHVWPATHYNRSFVRNKFHVQGQGVTLFPLLLIMTGIARKPDGKLPKITSTTFFLCKFLE